MSAPSSSGSGPASTRYSRPAKRTGSPRSSPATIWTYSSVCRPGAAYDRPSRLSMGPWCDGPTPRVSRPGAPMANATALARLACRTG